MTKRKNLLSFTASKEELDQNLSRVFSRQQTIARIQNITGSDSQSGTLVATAPSSNESPKRPRFSEVTPATAIDTESTQKQSEVDSTTTGAKKPTQVSIIPSLNPIKR
jgi:hypothetical protein